MAPGSQSGAGGPTTVQALGLPFDEAIDYLRDKVDIPTERWTALWHGMHARGFVVAGANTVALVEDFHKEVLAAAIQGTTKADFQRQFDAIVAKHGWDFRGGRRWRAGVIFNTNLRMAYASGKWAQIQRMAERRPWLRYVAVLDDHTRDEHRRWHNTILRWDHPWWRTHYAPNGWNCRCTVQQLSDADLERYGLTPTEAAPEIVWQKRQLNGADGPVEIEVPEGIDSGFAYNVGEASWGRGAQLKALHRADGEMADLTAPGVPQVPPAQLPELPPDRPRAERGPRRPAADEASTRRAFREALHGADEAIWSDPTGARIHTGPAVVDHILEDPGRRGGRVPFFPLMQELIEDPYEIWLGWARDPGGRVSLRRRYVKRIVEPDGKERFLTYVADAIGNQWGGLTYFPARAVAEAQKSRKGLLIYRRGE